MILFKRNKKKIQPRTFHLEIVVLDKSLKGKSDYEITDIIRRDLEQQEEGRFVIVPIEYSYPDAIVR